MSSLNKIMLIGNLGKDPELRATASGKSVANFSIATTDKFKGADGQKQEKTEWHNIVVWNQLAKICDQYLRKGSLIYIEGKIQTRSWDDKEGIKRYTTEVVGNNMQILNNRDGGKSQPSNSDDAQHQQAAGSQDDTEDDLPF